MIQQLLIYFYEITEGVRLRYLILQIVCLILQMSNRNLGFTCSILRICTAGVQCHPNSHP
jgi:hypothetical protein